MQSSTRSSGIKTALRRDNRICRQIHLNEMSQVERNEWWGEIRQAGEKEEKDGQEGQGGEGGEERGFMRDPQRPTRSSPAHPEQLPGPRDFSNNPHTPDPLPALPLLTLLEDFEQ